MKSNVATAVAKLPSSRAGARVTFSNQSLPVTPALHQLTPLNSADLIGSIHGAMSPCLTHRGQNTSMFVSRNNRAFAIRATLNLSAHT